MNYEFAVLCEVKTDTWFPLWRRVGQTNWRYFVLIAGNPPTSYDSEDYARLFVANRAVPHEMDNYDRLGNS